MAEAAAVLGVLLLVAVIYIASLRSDLRHARWRAADLQQRLTARQSNGGSVRRSGGTKAEIERARTTRRDTSDLATTGRQFRIVTTSKGGDSEWRSR
jgi:hypothetical protein